MFHQSSRRSMAGGGGAAALTAPEAVAARNDQSFSVPWDGRQFSTRVPGSMVCMLLALDGKRSDLNCDQTSLTEAAQLLFANSSKCRVVLGKPHTGRTSPHIGRRGCGIGYQPPPPSGGRSGFLVLPVNAPIGLRRRAMRSSGRCSSRRVSRHKPTTASGRPPAYYSQVPSTYFSQVRRSRSRIPSSSTNNPPHVRHENTNRLAAARPYRNLRRTCPGSVQRSG